MEDEIAKLTSGPLVYLSRLMVRRILGPVTRYAYKQASRTWWSCILHSYKSSKIFNAGASGQASRYGRARAE